MLVRSPLVEESRKTVARVKVNCPDSRGIDDYIVTTLIKVVHNLVKDEFITIIEY